MEYENNGLGRIIHDTIRMAGIILFGAWNEKYRQPRFLENGAQESFYQRLLDMIDNGKVNDAENMLLEHLEEEGISETILLSAAEKEDPQRKQRRQSLETALCVYGYMNGKTDDFLEEHDYSREEIQQGVADVMMMSGIQADIALEQIQ